MKWLLLTASLVFQMVAAVNSSAVIKTTEAVQWPSAIKGAMTVNPDQQVIYYGEENTITTLDTSLTAISGTISIDTAEMIQSLYYQDNKLFVAIGGDGVRVFKTDDKGAPGKDPIGIYDLKGSGPSGDPPGSANDMFAFTLCLKGEELYLVDTLYGIRRLALKEDALNPDHLTFQAIALYEKSRFPEGLLRVAVGDPSSTGNRFAYALDTFYGAMIFEATESATAEKIGIDEENSVLGANPAYDNYARAKDIFLDEQGLLYAPHFDYVEISPANVAIESRLAIYQTVQTAGAFTLSQTSITPIPGGYVSALDVAGGYAYIADTIGLQIIDARNPLLPAVAGVYPARTEGETSAKNALGSHGVKYMNGSVYLSSYFNSAEMGLFKGIKKINVENPGNPAETGAYQKKIDIKGVALSNEKTEDGESVAYLFAADQGEDGGGVRVFRITDGSSLDKMAAIDFLAVHGDSGAVADGALSGNYLFLLTDESGVEVWDASNPSVSFDRIGSVQDEKLNGAQQITLSGHTAYVAAGEKGLVMLDIEKPESPRIQALYDTEGSVKDVYVAGGYAYIADGEKGLLILSITDPTAPSLIGFLDTPGIASGVHVEETLAYVADGSEGLSVIDISAPQKPVLKGRIDTFGNAFRVRVSDQIAFVADGVEGMVAIDISKPADMERVVFPSYQTYGICTDLFLTSKIVNPDNTGQFAQYAFLADGPGGVIAVRLYENGVEKRSGDIDSGVKSCFLETAFWPWERP